MICALCATDVIALKMPTMLPDAFFDRDAQRVARELLGKVIRHRVNDLWLSARIIETEAYYCVDKGSHASLGYTEKRKALFLDGGHIYMYYARGGDSLNFSAHGPGNAVLIKTVAFNLWFFGVRVITGIIPKAPVTWCMAAMRWRAVARLFW